MLKNTLWILSCVVGLVFANTSQATESYKRSAGILIVGTQTEVKSILADTKVTVKFSEESPSAMVAVSLTKQGAKVYERDAVEDILKLIGGAVEGGVVLTLKVGSALWELLESLAGITVQTGTQVWNAIVWVLNHTTALVLSGVDFTVQAAGQVVQFASDVIAWIFGG